MPQTYPGRRDAWCYRKVPADVPLLPAGAPAEVDVKRDRTSGANRLTWGARRYWATVNDPVRTLIRERDGRTIRVHVPDAAVPSAGSDGLLGDRQMAVHQPDGSMVEGWLMRKQPDGSWLCGDYGWWPPNTDWVPREDWPICNGMQAANVSIDVGAYRPEYFAEGAALTVITLILGFAQLGTTALPGFTMDTGAASVNTGRIPYGQRFIARGSFNPASFTGMDRVVAQQLVDFGLMATDRTGKPGGSSFKVRMDPRCTQAQQDTVVRVLNAAIPHLRAIAPTAVIPAPDPEEPTMPTPGEALDTYLATLQPDEARNAAQDALIQAGIDRDAAHAAAIQAGVVKDAQQDAAIAAGVTKDAAQDATDAQLRADLQAALARIAELENGETPDPDPDPEPDPDPDPEPEPDPDPDPLPARETVTASVHLKTSGARLENKRIVRQGTYDEDAHAVVVRGDNGPATGVVVRNVEAVGWGVGFSTWNLGPNATFEDIETIDCGYGAYAQGVQGQVSNWRRCTFRNCRGFGVHLYEDNQPGIYGQHFHQLTIVGTGERAFIIQTDEARDIWLVDSHIDTSYPGGLLVVDAPLSDSRVTGTTLISRTGGVINLKALDGFTFTGNTVQGVNRDGAAIQLTSTVGVDEWDDNHYRGGVRFSVGGDQRWDFPTWQDVTGFDLHSTWEP